MGEIEAEASRIEDALGDILKALEDLEGMCRDAYADELADSAADAYDEVEDALRYVWEVCSGATA